jgi:hypothetical protein
MPTDEVMQDCTMDVREYAEEYPVKLLETNDGLFIEGGFNATEVDLDLCVAAKMPAGAASDDRRRTCPSRRACADALSMSPWTTSHSQN